MTLSDYAQGRAVCRGVRMTLSGYAQGRAVCRGVRMTLSGYAQGRAVCRGVRMTLSGYVQDGRVHFFSCKTDTYTVLGSRIPRRGIRALAYPLSIHRDIHCLTR